jgi:hypothetical protein
MRTCKEKETAGGGAGASGIPLRLYGWQSPISKQSTWVCSWPGGHKEPPDALDRTQSLYQDSVEGAHDSLDLLVLLR